MSSGTDKSQLPGLPGYNPDNIQPWTIEVVVSVTVLALLAVGLRLVSRHTKGQTLWWDDYLIVWSMVCLYCMPLIFLLAMFYDF